MEATGIGKIPLLTSRLRQAALFVLGAVLLVGGLIGSGKNENPPPPPNAPVSNATNTAVLGNPNIQNNNGIVTYGQNGNNHMKQR